MSGWELSPEALADLQEIWIYIAADNPSAADKLEAEIFEAFKLLAGHPRLGHKRPDLTAQDVRFWTVCGHYLIIYRHKTKPLQIVRILHGSRDVRERL